MQYLLVDFPKLSIKHCQKIDISPQNMDNIASQEIKYYTRRHKCFILNTMKLNLHSTQSSYLPF